MPLMHKMDLETCLCLDVGSAPCPLPKSIFSPILIAAAKCGWDFFILGDVPCKYKLLWGCCSSLAPRLPGSLLWGHHPLCSLKMFQQAQPKSCRVVGTLPAPRHPVDGADIRQWDKWRSVI